MKYKAGTRYDIWSLGCTVLVMITVRPAWPTLRVVKMSVTEGREQCALNSMLAPKGHRKTFFKQYHTIILQSKLK